MYIGRCFLFYVFMLCISNLVSADKPTFAGWLESFREKAVQQGIEKEIFDEAFANVKQPQEKIIQFDKTQPEFRQTLTQYMHKRVDPNVERGRQYLKKYQNVVQKIAQKYQVDPSAIIALWGVETNYGSFMGKTSVFQALSTLAYEGRRQSFFEGELLEALHILQDKHVALKDMYGSWAGAIGQCQFMPSSFRKYAVDEDQDGKKDIWNSYPDIFASIACYLKTKGWQYHAPWGIEVKLKTQLPAEILHHKISKSVQQWRQLGVVFLEDAKRDKTFEQRQASLIEVPTDPDGKHKMFLVFKNFKVLLDWNSSYLFALSVGLLSDKIKQ